MEPIRAELRNHVAYAVQVVHGAVPPRPQVHDGAQVDAGLHMHMCLFKTRKPSHADVYVLTKSKQHADTP